MIPAAPKLRQSQFCRPNNTDSIPEVVQHGISGESEPGSIPVEAIVETGAAPGVPAVVESPILFLPANTVRHLVSISVGIGSHRR